MKNLFIAFLISLLVVLTACNSSLSHSTNIKANTKFLDPSTDPVFKEYCVDSLIKIKSSQNCKSENQAIEFAPNLDSDRKQLDLKSCYYKEAITNRDEKFCSTWNGDQLNFMCNYCVSVLKRDVQICIDESSFYFSKNETNGLCRLLYAVALGDENVCNGIQDPTSRNICMYEVGVRLNLSPNKINQFLPNKCMLQSGLACLDSGINLNQINFVLQNEFGYGINSIVVKAENCGTTNSPATLNNGQKGTYIITCGTPLSGSRYIGELNVTYVDTDTGLKHNNIGQLVAMIG